MAEQVGIWETIRDHTGANKEETLANNISEFNAERLYRRASTLAAFYRGELVSEG